MAFVAERQQIGVIFRLQAKLRFDTFQAVD